jgi:LysR family glycine cleavage system transcriptional activator
MTGAGLGLPHGERVCSPVAALLELARLGVQKIDVERGPAFGQLHLMIEAALSGLGLALLPRFMVQEEVAAGRLVVPFVERVASGWGYWFIYPGDRNLGDAAAAFRNWLLRVASVGSPERWPRDVKRMPCSRAVGHLLLW